MTRALPVSEWPEADRLAWEAACRPGVQSISAGNFGGKLGPHHFHLRKIMNEVTG